MDSEARGIEQQAHIAELLAQAQAAYENDDSQSVANLCREVLDADPDNAQAWLLLAKFGGWDSKLYGFDVGFAIDAAKHALELVPETTRHDAAADIYTARKRQIGKILESEMMMPSYTAAKQLHGTMGEWQRLLVEIPYLTVNLLESEVELVDNLCKRSKLGMMPAERLVYTAYASLNKKESYGETFRKALAGRLSKEQEEQGARIEQMLEQATERNAELEKLATGATLPPAELKSLLEAELENLDRDIATIADLSNKTLYDQQLEELERQLATVKPYKIFRRQELTGRITETKEKIAQVDAGFKAKVAPLRSYEQALRARISGLS